MSYISNGCNDCASVDFGNNSLLGGNFMGGNGFESQQQNNQFMYQQPQQQQQPQMVQQMPQLPQQLPQQMPQQPKVQMMAPVKMQQQGQQQQVNVVAPAQPKQQNQSLTGVLGNYFYDNAFTITIAFLVASAWHTTIKYYIDHAIKFSGGTPTYYIAYAVLVTLAAIFLTTLKH